MQTTRQIVRDIKSELSYVNGKRKKRTLEYSDVIQAIREVFTTPDWFGWVLPYGMVGKSYRYPSSATMVAAIRLLDGTRRVQVAIWRGSGQSSGLEGCYHQARKGSIIMEESQALLLVELSDRASSGRKNFSCTEERWEQVADEPITVEDSLQAYNCSQETSRVSKWFPGRQEATIREVRDEMIQRGESHLIRYLERVVANKVHEQALAGVGVE